MAKTYSFLFLLDPPSAYRMQVSKQGFALERGKETCSKQFGMVLFEQAFDGEKMGSGHTPFVGRMHFTPCHLSTSFFAVLTSLLHESSHQRD